MANRPKQRTRLYGVKPSEKPNQGYIRNRSDDLYHTSRWTKESKAFRELNPLCIECEKSGVINASEVVDHIIPHPVCIDFWESTNWQALCKKCNAEKGNRDKKMINDFKNKNNHG